MSTSLGFASPVTTSLKTALPCSSVEPEKALSSMSMPFYVAPEQLMKDKADYARKGIARGRSLVAIAYADGILLAAENPSAHAAQN